MRVRPAVGQVLGECRRDCDIYVGEAFPPSYRSRQWPGCSALPQMRINEDCKGFPVAPAMASRQWPRCSALPQIPDRRGLQGIPSCKEVSELALSLALSLSKGWKARQIVSIFMARIVKCSLAKVAQMGRRWADRQHSRQTASRFPPPPGASVWFPYLVQSIADDAPSVLVARRVEFRPTSSRLHVPQMCQKLNSAVVQRHIASIIAKSPSPARASLARHALSSPPRTRQRRPQPRPRCPWLQRRRSRRGGGSRQGRRQGRV